MHEVGGTACLRYSTGFSRCTKTYLVVDIGGHFFGNGSVLKRFDKGDVDDLSQTGGQHLHGTLVEAFRHGFVSF